MIYTHIIFDLDGTLIDSKKTFKRSLEYALMKMNIKDYEIDNINAFIGPSLFETFNNVYGFTNQEAQQAYTYYMDEYIGNKQIFKAKLYDYVCETIDFLLESDYFIGIATTKDEKNARSIIKHHDIEILENRIYGTFRDRSRPDKASVIQALLKDHLVKNNDQVLMIGDRYTDIEGARSLGIDSVGVTYGYGSESELLESGATYLISHLSELSELIA